MMTVLREIDGLKFNLPTPCSIERIIRQSGLWEPVNFSFLKKHIRPHDSFVDIGAHVGIYSIAAARLTQGDITAYEPVIANYSCLLQNISENNCDGRIKPIRAAAWNSNGATTIYKNRDNSGDNMLGYMDDFETEIVSTVDAAGIDADVIKVDTQGSEGMIFSRLPLERARVIITEFAPWWMNKTGGLSPASLLRVFKRHFRVYASFDTARDIVEEVDNPKRVLEFAANKHIYLHMIRK